MEETLKILNQMVADKVIENYAIGGAVAAIYYLEPFDTVDLDIFVQVATDENALMILAPIYNYLTARGYPMESEYIRIEGFPVRFLPVFNSLTDEAVQQANSIIYEQTTTRIMRAEHLIAIMLDTGRIKDFLRINMFLEQAKFDEHLLESILLRHDLQSKWKANKQRFKL